MVGVATSAAAAAWALTALTAPVGAAPAALPTGDGLVLNAPIVDVASTPGGDGYWEGASDGGVFAFGDAGFYGSTGTLHLDQSIVGMTSTPDGRGYREVGSDGGIFAFGDAGFYGSASGLSPGSPIVGMASTPDGQGYWVVASDGGVFAFGGAGFYGSTGGLPLNRPVIGMSAIEDGYVTVASDGGIFSFGGAGFYGSLGGSTLSSSSGSGTTTSADGLTDYQRAAWDRVNICEQGGRWDVRGSLFSGGLGFSNANWSQFNSFGYPASAADATPEQQIRVAVAFAARYWGNPDAAPDQHGCGGGY